MPYFWRYEQNRVNERGVLHAYLTKFDSVDAGEMFSRSSNSGSRSIVTRGLRRRGGAQPREPRRHGCDDETSSGVDLLAFHQR
jgi:hypothetical protein